MIRMKNAPPTSLSPRPRWVPVNLGSARMGQASGEELTRETVAKVSLDALDALAILCQVGLSLSVRFSVILKSFDDTFVSLRKLIALSESDFPDQAKAARENLNNTELQVKDFRNAFRNGLIDIESKTGKNFDEFSSSLITILNEYTRRGIRASIYILDPRLDPPTQTIDNFGAVPSPQDPESKLFPSGGPRNVSEIAYLSIEDQSDKENKAAAVLKGASLKGFSLGNPIEFFTILIISSIIAALMLAYGNLDGRLRQMGQANKELSDQVAKLAELQKKAHPEQAPAIADIIAGAKAAGEKGEKAGAPPSFVKFLEDLVPGLPGALKTGTIIVLALLGASIAIPLVISIVRAVTPRAQE